MHYAPFLLHCPYPNVTWLGWLMDTAFSHCLQLLLLFYPFHLFMRHNLQSLIVHILFY